MFIETLKKLQGNATAAHVVPLAVFLLLLMVPSAVEIAHPSQPWWRQGPEHWIYPLQTVICLALVIFWWRHYVWWPADWRRLALGALIGVAGIALWIFPGWLHDQTGWHVRWLGVVSRDEPGFYPHLFVEGTPAWWTTVTLRFLRLVVAVPLVEEIFWRGFLWRYLADEDQPWWRLSIGIPSVRALLGTSVLMMLAHHPLDWAACFVWALLVGLVAITTRSLAACVVCHAVSNLILGLYVMRFEKWGLW